MGFSGFVFRGGNIFGVSWVEGGFCGFFGEWVAMAAAAAGGTRATCWPMAQQQHHVARGSGIGGASSSGGSQALLKRCPDRLELNRVLPVAVAAPSQFLVTRSSWRRGNLVLCSGKFELRAIRGSTRAVTHVVEATTAGLRETVEATAVVNGHSRSFEGIQTEPGACLAFLGRRVILSWLTFHKSMI